MQDLNFILCSGLNPRKGDHAIKELLDLGNARHGLVLCQFPSIGQVSLFSYRGCLILVNLIKKYLGRRLIVELQQ